MSDFKVVRDSAGKITAFGPNNKHFKPFIAEGRVMTLEETSPSLPPDPMQEKLSALPSITDFLVAYLSEDNVALAAMKDQYNLKKPK